jgi:S-adenosylmethionine hydrolase
MRKKAGTLLKRSGIITLLSDFGLQDVYVSVMKGVILNIAPKATLVDLSHTVSRHNIRQGAFLLSQASSYFPQGTIHLAVVDPGVGTSRRRIAIKGKRCLYVGPDNGLLLHAAKTEGIEKVVELRNEPFFLPSSSTTFEGRDIFAPVAANLVNGVSLDALGPEIHDAVDARFMEPIVIDERIMGQVLHIDWFGTLITNISRTVLEKVSIIEGQYLELSIDGLRKILPYCRAYGDIAVNTPLVIMGSGGFLEVSVNQGSAAALFNVDVGSKVEVLLWKRSDSK